MNATLRSRAELGPILGQRRSGWRYDSGAVGETASVGHRLRRWRIEARGRTSELEIRRCSYGRR